MSGTEFYNIREQVCIRVQITTCVRWFVNKTSHFVLFLFIEQFSIECLKIKTNVITLANHKVHRAIHCPKLHKTLENLREQVTIGFGFTSDGLKKWREFFNQSLSVVMENQSNRKLLSTLK